MIRHKYLFLSVGLAASILLTGAGHSEFISAGDIPKLLTIDRHLEKPLSIGKDHKDYGLFLRQKEAIKKAGDLRMVKIVPQLIVFLDYPSNPAGAMGATFRTRSGINRIKNTRKIWPAYNAILEIGEPAVVHLEKFIKDSEQDLGLRLATLEILQDINSRIAETIGGELLDIFEQTNQQSAHKRVRAILEGKSHFWGVKSKIRGKN